MNEPVPLSSFGEFTNKCAELFCDDKDGLELWLSLVNDCKASNLTSLTSLNIDNESVYFVDFALFVGFVCAFISLIILMK
jgi:hypothetical protein